jgi:hypothetical protein
VHEKGEPTYFSRYQGTDSSECTVVGTAGVGIQTRDVSVRKGGPWMGRGAARAARPTLTEFMTGLESTAKSEGSMHSLALKPNQSTRPTRQLHRLGARFVLVRPVPSDAASRVAFSAVCVGTSANSSCVALHRSSSASYPFRHAGSGRGNKLDAGEHTQQPTRLTMLIT